MSVPAAYLAVVLVWSTTPLAIVWSSETVHPMMAAWLRMAIAALLGWMLVRTLKLELPWHWKAIRSYGCAVIGIFGGMCCTYLAVGYVSSGLISVIYGLAPLVSGMLAQQLIGEARFRPYQWLAFAIALSGLGSIFAGDLRLAEEGWPGVLLLLAAVFLFSLSGVLVKRVGADVHPLPHTVGTLLFSLPLFGLSWLVTDGHWPVLDFGSHSPWAILYLATFGSLVGFVCYFYVLKRLSATTVALVTLITPVFALMLGSLLNGEAISASLMVGTGIILSGLSLYFWGDRLQWARRRLA